MKLRRIEESKQSTYHLFVFRRGFIFGSWGHHAGVAAQTICVFDTNRVNRHTQTAVTQRGWPFVARQNVTRDDIPR